MESGSVDNRIQVLGGEGNNGAPEGVFALNEEYDPASDTWRALAPRPTPRQRLYGMIGAARAAVPYSGLAPSRAGLYQVNARIP